MGAYTQDTWILNVATNATPDQDRFVHYCRIELPAGLSEHEATIRSRIITNSIVQSNPLSRWLFSLMRWELRGREIDVPW